MKKLDSNEHARRAAHGKPLLPSDCEMCKIIVEMNDAAITKEDLEFSS